MKQRHLLLHRQHMLFPQFRSRQPLTAYISRRQELARALGLLETDGAQAEKSAELVIQPWWPLQADQQSASVSNQFAEEAAPAHSLPAKLEEPARAANLPQAEDAGPREVLPHTTRGMHSPAWGTAEDASLRETFSQADTPTQVPVRTTEETRQQEAAPQTIQESAADTTPSTRARLVHSRIAELQESSTPQALPAFIEDEKAQPGENSFGANDPQERLFPSTQEISSPEEDSVLRASPEQEQPAAELFAPSGTDRSPQAWLARLNRREQKTGRQETRPASSAESRKTQASKSAGPAMREQNIRHAEPVSQNARAFLRPLLGIDPAAVPIYRDEQAAEGTSLEQADALSNGEMIEIAPEHSAQTPETLALLAHELTHVARRQNPRFVPPVALAQPPASSWETGDEEALALHVEGQALQLARGAPAMDTMSAAQPPLRREPGTSILPPASARPIWGNLPAPWEPLPDWLASASSSHDVSAQPGADLSVASRGAELSAVTPLSTPAMFAPGESRSEGESEVRRAGLERSIEEPGAGATNQADTPSAPEPARAPEPDLDALARQVYGLLKRRLSVEQRREL